MQQPSPAVHSRHCIEVGVKPSARRRRLPSRPVRRGQHHPRAQQQRQRHHDEEAADSDPGPGFAPADLFDPDLEQRGPHRPREVGTADNDGGGDAAPAIEPVGDVGDQRDHDRGHAEEADQQAECKHDVPKRRRLSGEEEPGRDRDAPGENRAHMVPMRSDHQPMTIPPKPNPVKSTA